MRLASLQADGCSLRTHLQQAAQATGRPDPALLRQLPAWAVDLWAAFCDLAAGRPQGMGGAGAIQMTELAAWQALHGVHLSPWEVGCITAMDQATLATTAEKTPRT